MVTQTCKTLLEKLDNMGDFSSYHNCNRINQTCLNQAQQHRKEEPKEVGLALQNV